jgi:acyl CoA:acetate/3-ketoacid CoA transferase
MSGKIVPFEEAVARIPDGCTISICGAWMLVPDRTLAALEQRFLSTGHPQNLTAVYAICPGGTDDQPGIQRLSHAGLLRRVVAGSFPIGGSSQMWRLIEGNQIEAYNLPTGMIVRWLREIGSGSPGAITRRGVGTFVDPRQTGGKMNARTSEDLLSVVHLEGTEALFLPSAPIHVSIIRATTADEDGNLTFEHESATLTSLVQAMAARASRGLVIVQVERITRTGTLNPHLVKVPGTLVDMVVVDPGQLQASCLPRNPALSGEVVDPCPALDLPSGVQRRMVERAVQEIREGDVVVLGFGISAYVPHLLHHTNNFDKARFLVEQGSIGGLPLTNLGFGNSINPRAILDAAAQFDLFQGGNFDLAMLSFLQVDAQGRVNVHRLDAKPGLSVGIGGFLDISASARRLIFLGYFTAGLAVEEQAGEIRIVKEGKSRKFIERVDHVSFDPHYSEVREMKFITERAVLSWSENQTFLEEVSPGIDLEKDVLAQMGFKPSLARLKKM